MGAVRDIRNQLKALIAMEPQTINTDTTTIGEIIDTANYDGGIVFTQLVTHTSGTFTPYIQESSSPTFASDVSDVPDASLIGDVETGQEADSALTAAQLVSSLGVVNNSKRYLRYSCVSSAGANGVFAATVHKKAEVVKISN